MVLNNILNIIDLYEYITIVDITPEANNKFVILALVVRIEVFEVFSS